MADVFIKLGQGGAVNYKQSVPNVASLPAVGNVQGDVRVTLDTSSLYIWDGTSWQLATGGSGSPGGTSGAIQFNNSGTFGGDAELKWDSTGKFLELNGLAIKALSSSISLVDNTSTPTTAFSYDAATYNYAIVEYSLTRNTAKQVGRMLIVNDASTVSLNNDFGNLNDTGVTFSATVSAGNVLVQYTTTNTGFNGFLKYSIRQWI